MSQETHRRVTVQPGGKIEVIAPEFPAGTEVEVTISANSTTSSKAPKKEKLGRKAQEIVRRYVPEGVMLSEELIQERRRESERE
jgi:hypothetical protein